MTLDELKALSPEDQKVLIKKITAERQKGKTTNYASVYGAGGKTIASAADVPESVGFELHAAYWELHWSIKELANIQTIKFFYKMGDGKLTYKLYTGRDLIRQDSDSQQESRVKQHLVNSAESMWLLNPINKLWYSLRFPKDIVSTLIQGSGTYAFDTWVKNTLKNRRQLTGQFHD